MGELAQVVESGTGITPVRDVDYTYDALNRLTSEESRRSLGGGGLDVVTTTYTYDSVGNRLAVAPEPNEPSAHLTPTR